MEKIKVPTLVQDRIQKEVQFATEQYHSSQSNILKEFEITPREILSPSDVPEKFKIQIENLITDIFHGRAFSDELLRKPAQPRRKATLCLYYEGEDQMIDTYKQSLEDYFLLRGFKFVDDYAFLFDSFEFIGENILTNELNLKDKTIVLPTLRNFKRPKSGKEIETYLGISLPYYASGNSANTRASVHSQIGLINTDRIDDECYDARSQHRRFQSCWKSNFCFLVEKIL